METLKNIKTQEEDSSPEKISIPEGTEKFLTEKDSINSLSSLRQSTVDGGNVLDVNMTSEMLEESGCLVDENFKVDFYNSCKGNLIV